ncbi:MAG TPA: type II toxin-antitoxin system VapC family toxin [Candidatus Diapherotrites archaeon]|uniref:Type II toxin-antitoxin system VapC family toxin n=1 Tax=Candidatus Iainarchaeum sp. TaxID=3101447 RepID=A0A7J4J1I8_9ARCH|nr:type II toxin-antitoxin system VapC family toxin [Candidatus Diapherotrites archaeon]
MGRYFLDSYALIEMLEGNPKYDHYNDTDFAITKLNLIEVHYYLTKKRDFRAKEIAQSLAVSIVDFDNDIIFAANGFRFKNKSKDFSTADCIGYIFAVKNGLIFVTGGKEFEGLPGVEFVRK